MSSGIRVFIGSSSEAEATLLVVAQWIEAARHVPIPWNRPGVFPPGSYTLSRLRQIAREVDAAILIFTEDDKTWYRTDTVYQPRDNVLLEYGLFTGTLGERKVIFCRKGKPKIPNDLAGLTYVDISDTRQAAAQLNIRSWLDGLTQPDPATLLRDAVEPLTSPFVSSGKRTLFLQGTSLLKRATRRVALVANTPIPLVGPRPYDVPPESSYPYELEQYAAYLQLLEDSASGSGPTFVCIASVDAMREDLLSCPQRLPSTASRHIARFDALARKPESQSRLRWYEGRHPTTFLVVDDAFMIWFKNQTGDSVWIAASNAAIADALYGRALSHSIELPLSDCFNRLSLAQPTAP